MEMDGLLAIV